MKDLKGLDSLKEKVLKRIKKVSRERGFITKRMLSHDMAYAMGSGVLNGIVEELIEIRLIVQRKSDSNGIVFCSYPPTIEFISITKPCLGERIKEESLEKGLKVCPCCFGGIYVSLERYNQFKNGDYELNEEEIRTRDKVSDIPIEDNDYEKEDIFYIPDGSIMDILTSKGEKGNE